MNGFTIVYVNGIFTPDKSTADADLYALQGKFIQAGFDTNNIDFITGYNPSHLSGFGDVAQVASQILNTPISDYDLKNILFEIYPQVTTRKLLLVGHSQGTFYTNEIYDYITKNGESAGSVGVYNVATPARGVAGDGAHLTSTNDEVINLVRRAVANVGGAAPLSANITIPVAAADPLGHSFQDVYLAFASSRIIPDIEDALGKLSAADAADNADGGCFTPPAKDFSYRAQQAFFAAADPMTGGVVAALDVSRKVKDIAAAMVEDTIVATAGEIKNVASGIFVFEAGTKISPVPAPDVSKETVHQTNDKTAASARAEKTGTENAVAVSVTKINDAGPISDSSGNAPDSVAPVLIPDSAITNGGTPRGGISAGSLGSISAPGAGAAPSDSVVSAVTGAAEQDQTPPSTASTTPAAETSTPTPAALPAPDTTSPDISFAIPECSAASISDDGCLLTSPTINLSWTSTADDTNHFAITCAVDGAPCADFSFAPTNATATEYVLPLDGKTYTFTAQAIDAAGNASDTVAKTVAFSAMPVVINEVAWMGTGSSAITSKDEWIELYNATDETIALSDWALSFYAPATTTPSHTIALSGSIPAKGFYLIERTDDTAVADIPADLTSSFGSGGLLNSGMIVKLERGGALVDRTPEPCGGTWCAGSAATYQTMERIDPAASGQSASNWGTALGEFIMNGISADGGTVKGTPKKRNSLNYLIAQSGALLQSKTLTKAHSPYLIARPGLTVSSGVVLTLDAGVVVKIANSDPSIVVNGTIQANGTADEPVVFTSFLDDAYGGDMNADGMCDAGNASSTAACPSPGDWKQVDINSSGGSSHFDHTLFRYGGRWYSNMTIRAMVVADGASPAFSNATFAYSQKHGLYLNNSSSSVTGNVFSNNNVDADAAGLVIAGGAPSIQQSTFSANSIGLSVSGGASPAVSGNTFSGNTGDAVAVASSRPQFSGNSASGNGTNGIRFSNGPGAGSGGYTFAKDLPYVISGNFILPAGETFTIQPGAVFKHVASASWDVHGVLTAEGTAEEPIVITSLTDDEYGGDTNNNGAATVPAPGDWGSLTFAADSISSTLAHAIIRYGSGYMFCGFSGGAVIANGTSIAVADAVFEKNKAAGLWLMHSASTTVSATTFRDHQGSDCAVGLRLTGSYTMLDGVSFVHNRLGILAESSSTVTLGESGVTFTGNTASTSPENLTP